MPVRIAIVEDNPEYRAGLAALLGAEAGFEVVDVFAAAAPAIEAAERGARWDLVLTDLGLPDRPGTDVIRQVKALHPALPVVALTVFEEPPRIVDAICAGADGYLLKRTEADELITQLRAVLAGGSPLTPGVARTVLDVLRRGDASPAEDAAAEIDLSPREREVLRLLAEGLVVKQAADRLGISLETARTYVRRIYEKLQVRTVAHAVSRAVRDRLI